MVASEAVIERFWDSWEEAERWARERILPFVPPLASEYRTQLINVLVMLAPPEIDHVSHPMVCRALSAAGVATADFPARFAFDFPPCAVELDLLHDPLFLAIAVHDVLNVGTAAAVHVNEADVWIRGDGYVAPIETFERVLGQRRTPRTMSVEVFSDELFEHGAVYTPLADERARTAPWDAAEYVRPEPRPLPSELAREGWNR